MLGTKNTSVNEKVADEAIMSRLLRSKVTYVNEILILLG